MSKELAAKGISVAAISVDAVAANRALTGKLGLSFPVLSDPGGTVMR
ncbi:MAG: redoxin domain-containing protein, partial [Deltaproteobacteria bacterium]|nr:redoxin domain-containing protein [Deltaproteobacteria bacterium]